MCGLCGALNNESHWSTDITDRDTDNRSKKLNRIRRIKILNTLFKIYGISIRSGTGSFYVVSNRTGVSEVAYNLDSVLNSCEKLSGYDIDPLRISV